MAAVYGKLQEKTCQRLISDLKNEYPPGFTAFFIERNRAKPIQKMKSCGFLSICGEIRRVNGFYFLNFLEEMPKAPFVPENTSMVVLNLLLEYRMYG